jgi:hypothetical protein
MSTREMAPMCVPDSGFCAPKIDGIHPHFAVLHRKMRRNLASRIGDSDAIPAYESNLLDATMKNEHFDVFDYIVDEIWNIAINPLCSCCYAPFIMCMIETVAKERFYKDVAHEPLRPALPKVPILRHTSPPLMQPLLALPTTVVPPPPQVLTLASRRCSGVCFLAIVPTSAWMFLSTAPTFFNGTRRSFIA